MEHLLNQKFDKVVCINLAERRDKRDKMGAKLDRLGIQVEWFTAVQYGFIPKISQVINQTKVGHFNPQQPFELGAALSHYHVIKQALAEGAKSIFVLEDDVLFHKEFNKKLDSYYRELPENWDMFLLYSFMYQWLPQNTRINARWARSYKSWSLMSYGMRGPIMEEYIRKQDNFLTISDAVTYQMQEESKWNILSAVPSLCLPDTYLGSNIRGSNLNYQYNPTVTNWGVSNDNYE